MVQTVAEELGRIPMSPALQASLKRARDYASVQGHLQVALEHLLLALTEDDDAAAVLQACRVDLGRLRNDVAGHIGAENERTPDGSPSEPAISAGLTQILKYATLAARQGKRPRIDGAIVLAAVVGDGRSMAAAFLKAQGLTFEAAIRALQQAGTPAQRRPPETPEPAPPQPAPPQPAPPAARHPPAPSPAEPVRPEQPISRPAPPGRTGAASAEDILAAARARLEQRLPRPEAGVGEPVAPAEPVWEPPGPLPVAIAPQQQPPEGGALAARSLEAVQAAQALGDAATAMSGPGLAPDAAPNPPEAVRLAEPGLDRAFAGAAEPPEPAPHLAGGYEPHAQPRAMPPPSAAPWTSPPLPPAGDSGVPAAAATQPPPVSGPSGAPSWAPPPLPTMPRPPPAAPRLPRAMPPPAGPPLRPPPAAVPAGARGPEAAPRVPWSGATEPGPLPGPPLAPPSPTGELPLHPDAERRPAMAPLQPVAPAMPAQPLPPAPHILPAGAPPGRAPALDASHVAHTIPGRLTVGLPRTVEVRIARPPLPPPQPHQPVSLRGETVAVRAISVRLRPMRGACAVDAPSPETLWDKPTPGRLASEAAVWRFVVTPSRNGRSELSLQVVAHVVGADGVVAETALPEQVVRFSVLPNFLGIARRWGIAIALLIGALVMKEGIEMAFRVDVLHWLKRLVV